MKNYTILLFSGDLSKICWTKLDLLQDIRKFYGELFDVHVFLNPERNCQSVAFIPLATHCLILHIRHVSAPSSSYFVDHGVALTRYSLLQNHRTVAEAYINRVLLCQFLLRSNRGNKLPLTLYSQ